MKNALESTRSRADQIEERISKLADRNIEMIQVERELRFFFKKMNELHENYLTPLERAT